MASWLCCGFRPDVFGGWEMAIVHSALSSENEGKKPNARPKKKPRKNRPKNVRRGEWNKKARAVKSKERNSRRRKWGRGYVHVFTFSRQGTSKNSRPASNRSSLPP